VAAQIFRSLVEFFRSLVCFAWARLGATFSFVWGALTASWSDGSPACCIKTPVLLPCLACSSLACSSSHGLASSLHLLVHPAMACSSSHVLHGFDLNVRMEEDDDGSFFNLNEPILEDHNNNGNVLILTHFSFIFLIFTALT